MLRLVKEYKESWNVVKRQAEIYCMTNAVQDLRKLQELAKADLILYGEVQKAIPGYKNTDKYLGVLLDVLQGEENYSIN